LVSKCGRNSIWQQFTMLDVYNFQSTLENYKLQLQNWLGNGWRKRQSNFWCLKRAWQSILLLLQILLFFLQSVFNVTKQKTKCPQLLLCPASDGWYFIWDCTTWFVGPSEHTWTVEIALHKRLWCVGHVMISVIHGPKSGMYGRTCMVP
jgi:hypothetical protein